MAKLYWRVKRDGRWTWTAANVVEVKEAEGNHPGYSYVRNLEEEE